VLLLLKNKASATWQQYAAATAFFTNFTNNHSFSFVESIRNCSVFFVKMRVIRFAFFEKLSGYLIDVTIDSL